MGYIRKHSKYKDTQGYGGRSASAQNDAAHISNRPYDWAKDAPELGSMQADATPPHGMVRPSRPTGAGKIVVSLQHNLGSDAQRTIENTLRYGK